MSLSVHYLSHSYGIHTTLDDVTFHLNPGERVGLAGANGCGKTTLLRILTGELAPTSGTVTFADGVEAGYLPQRPPPLPAGATVDDLIDHTLGDLREIEARLRELEGQMSDPEADLDAVIEEYGALQGRFEARGGYDLEHRIEAVLHGLGLGDLPRDQPVRTLSGGEAARVQLAALLLSAPDLLLLDEPTNHLDFASIDWLGEYLAGQPGAMLIVSHDRHFLNQTVTRILEIDEHSHRLKSYPGNYDHYRETIERERADWEGRYAAQQAEINELRRAIKQSQASLNRKPPPRRDADKNIYNAQAERAQYTVGTTVRDLRERLRRIEEDPVPKPPERMQINAHFNEEELASSVIIQAQGVSVSFAGKPVLHDVDFFLGRGERVVIVGPNGAGKSTFLEVITGRRAPDAGTVAVAPGARIGYLDQGARLLDDEKSVFDAYREGIIEEQHHLISDLLRHGLFVLDDLEKRVGDLSLGQRRKLQIARMMATNVNLLIIDEPTNYVSFDVLEALERALAEFPGPVLTVSHDRWFIERFGGQIWELRDGRLRQYHDDAVHVLPALTA